MFDLEKEVDARVAELPWEIKRKSNIMQRDFDKINNECDARMFCFAWGVPQEVLYFLGGDLLKVPWGDLKVHLQGIAQNCFWESPIEVYKRFIKTIEGWHFSPFIKEEGGFFSYEKIENDPPDRPVLILKMDPGLKKMIDGEFNLMAKLIWGECSRRIPRSTGSNSYFWHPRRARDPIYHMKFVLDGFSSNHYKVSIKSLQDAFAKILNEYGLLPPSPRLNCSRAERLTRKIRGDEFDDTPFENTTINRDDKKIEELTKAYTDNAIKKKLLFSLDSPL